MIVLGRTTRAPRPRERGIPSPVAPTCSLDKNGWWLERHKHTLDRKRFGTAACEFRGALPVEDAKALAEFWEEIRWG